MSDRLVRKYCKYCHNIFYTKVHNKWYCSRKCQQQANRQKQVSKGYTRKQEWYVIAHHERLMKQLEQERQNII